MMGKSLALSRIWVTANWARIRTNLQSTNKIHSILGAFRRFSGATHVRGCIVRVYAVCVTILLVFSSLLASAGTAFKATTTLAAETANNTSAANSFATQTN